MIKAGSPWTRLGVEINFLKKEKMYSVDFIDFGLDTTINMFFDEEQTIAEIFKHGNIWIREMEKKR